MTATSNTTSTVEFIGDGGESGQTLFQSATEKGSFYGATPIVRPAITAVATTTATTTLNETRIGRIETALVNLGLISTDG